MTSFMREHIKKKPFYKKPWFTKTVGMVCFGAVFGAAAALAFSLTLPWARKILEPRRSTAWAERRRAEMTEPQTDESAAADIGEKRGADGYRSRRF